MNYLLTEEMTEYRDELEQMLFRLPLASSALRNLTMTQSENDQRQCLFRQKTLLFLTAHLIWLHAHDTHTL